MRKNLGDFNIFNTFLDTYSEISWSFSLKVSSPKKFLKILEIPGEFLDGRFSELMESTFLRSFPPCLIRKRCFERTSTTFVDNFIQSIVLTIFYSLVHFRVLFFLYENNSQKSWLEF